MKKKIKKQSNRVVLLFQYIFLGENAQIIKVSIYLYTYRSVFVELRIFKILLLYCSLPRSPAASSVAFCFSRVDLA